MMIDNKDKNNENIDKEKTSTVNNISYNDELPSININEINLNHESPVESKKEITGGNSPVNNFNLNNQKSHNDIGKRYTNDRELYKNNSTRPEQQTPKPDDTSVNKSSGDNNNIINQNLKPSPDNKVINVNRTDVKKNSENTSDSLQLKKNNQSSMLLSPDFKVDKNLTTRKMDFSFPVKFRGAEYFRLVDSINKLLDTSSRDIEYNKVDKSLAQMELVLHYLHQVKS